MSSRNSPALLVLAASRHQLDAIRRARDLGLRVVTVDNVPANPGHALADRSYDVSTTDAAKVLEIARHERVAGVLAACTDVAVPTAALVAEALGLPGPTVSAAEILCDKRRFRSFLSQSGFPSPEAWAIQSAEEVQRSWFLGRRWVLKPARSSGSKGIFILRTHDDLLERWPATAPFCGGQGAVLERYVEGHQGTCEGLLRDGTPRWYAVLDRRTADPPFVATQGHRVPTSLPASLVTRLLEQLTRLFGLLGVQEGPFDCDFVATDREVYLLEASPRLGGNSISRLLKATAGVDLMAAAVAIAMGHEPRIPEPAAPRPASLVLLGTKSDGDLSYSEEEALRLRAEPWVEWLELEAARGQAVQAFIDGRRCLGEALVWGRDAEEADAHASELLRRLDLRAA